ncbi:biotin-independent malonate decarboxylase subunit beta [Companilactobacillus alimentarius]|uniref:Biotin-independent malonate decarboxylase subunit beta n=1 Tax=Companilactobacillus alimentarius DSM 20249 TaxID=1423720 RepID=A0A2K9HKV5_9LACO|nr:biotin-independent malonate decarboxylase subunit beta [Companilactobacillus alimentarius]AUI71555.1 biotin-independent malonate decarboxylase subunit beta [Companilactobacillus alimentarius DSM 20249]KRK78444.1 malonate decarboxylase, beta subunit [Companilactobacillus alimentarius DSM 20249]MDT6953465.1 biotin-independent malonate decarboxylase subunit beta [Companilactobacillus alimentarius]GEO44719.1 biotin-independent malonate decarboxylase subunit beta [Companilactobacillus alimentariu
MKNSFVELHARERALSLLDAETAKELVGPLDDMISPHLEPQGIVPESDDGIVLMKGKIDGNNVLVISIEGKFQGGGIGEVSGSKIVAALEKALEDNKNGKTIYPILVLDTGGVRLQEANYGLLSISEIQNVVIALKKYVPVIGLVPGRVGSFGGMSITASILSYLIATNKARIALNGPEVIEQEAGVREFDSSDKNLIWNTLGTKQRLATGLVDEVVDDTVDSIKASLVNEIKTKKDAHRTENVDFYLSLLDKLDLSKKLDIETYDDLFKQVETVKHDIPEAITSFKEGTKSRGRVWFEAITGIKNATSSVSTVLHAQKDGKEYVAIVPDAENDFPRVRNGEVGLQEGFAVASIINKVVAEDKDKDVKRPIILIVDVPSQAYGYQEELIGIHVALGSSAAAYAKARQAGHPVIDFIPGDAVSGGFLAHGLQSNRMIALDDDSITIQAMSKASAARITQRTISELEEATKHVPAMAYDIDNYEKLGALYKLVKGIGSWEATDENVEKIDQIIDEAIASLDGDKTLHFRYETPIAKASGRKATLKVRQLVDEQW